MGGIIAISRRRLIGGGVGRARHSIGDERGSPTLPPMTGVRGSYESDQRPMPPEHELCGGVSALTIGRPFANAAKNRLHHPTGARATGRSPDSPSPSIQVGAWRLPTGPPTWMVGGIAAAVPWMAG